MSNPWPHRSRSFDPERGQYVSRPGEDVAEDVAVTWSSALAEAGHSLDEIDNCAARVRDGARAACKRLRGERDTMRALVTARGHVIDALTEERDEARGQVERLLLSSAALREAGQLALDSLAAALRELRALEWLTTWRDGLWLRIRSGVIVTEEDPAGRVEHPTYASAARELGWEG